MADDIQFITGRLEEARHMMITLGQVLEDAAGMSDELWDMLLDIQERVHLVSETIEEGYDGGETQGKVYGNTRPD